MPAKATAAATGTGVAGAVTILILAFWPKADPTTVAALQTVISAVLAFAATWFTPHNGPTQ